MWGDGESFDNQFELWLCVLYDSYIRLQLRQQGTTLNALLQYVIDFHRPVGGANSVRKGSRDCLLIKSEEEPQFHSVQFLIKDVPIKPTI